MRHRTIMTLAFGLAVACSDREELQSWIGRDATLLSQVWGQPTEETTHLDGRDVIYISYWRDGPYSLHRCQRTFGVNTLGIIVTQASSGC